MFTCDAWAPAGTGKRGHLPPLPPPPLPRWKCCFSVLCISSYSNTLSRRIIYALFSQPVVSFWTPRGGFRPQTPNLPTPGKDPAGIHAAMLQ